MKCAAAILVAALTLLLSGCVLTGKQQTAKSTPPTPKPASTPSNATPPRPLSAPQTRVELPPPQSVSAEAVAATQVPEETVEAAPATRPIRRQPGAVIGPRPNPVETQSPAAATAAPPPQPAAEERPPIGEIVPAQTQRRYQESAQAHRRDIRQLVEQARAHGMSGEQSRLVTRIEQFVKLSEEAEGGGNMRQADELAERGLILAKELQGVR